MVECYNLMQVWRQATPAERKRWRGWYVRAHRWCKRVSRRTHTPLYVVVGVLAALSPGTRWERNKRETLAILYGKDSNFTTYPRNVEKALAIKGAASELEVLRLLRPHKTSGMKVHAFYSNIMHPLTVGPVTIDRHAISIVLGRPLTKSDGQLTPLQYERIAEVYRLAAEWLGMKPQQVQAITWEAWRKYGAPVKEEWHEY